MFKRLFTALSIAAMSVVAAAAQTTPVDDFKKAEFYVGYSNGQVDTGLDSGNSASDFFSDRANFHGINVSGVYNVSRYIGIKADASGTFNNTRFSDTFFDPTTSTTYTASFKTTNSLYNVVGGVQVKDNSREGTFKPFAHAMVGLGHVRTKVSDVQCTPVLTCPVINESFSDNGLSGIIGGGIDIKLNNSVQIRAIQIDYNPIRIAGATDHNLRIGAGIVF
ncbi:MAG TPA: hypothetical protein VNA22_04055 [Pyrinomonadaceae bacterium]|nr:hypothetical protein [Pyrinomonadaceae bacterium]